MVSLPPRQTSKDGGGKTGLGVQRTRLTPAASTRVKTSQTWGPPTVTSCSLLPLGRGFPMESRLGDGVGNSASSQKLSPHPTPPHPTSLHLGRRSLESRNQVCQGREDAVGDCRICILPSPGSPPGRPHPAPSSRSTLTFRQPWSSSVAPWLSWPAFLQMDGKDWLQGLSFQRPSWEYRARGSLSPVPLHLPNPSANLVSRPDPASACCVILSKRLDLSMFQAIKWGEQG